MHNIILWVKETCVCEEDILMKADLEVKVYR